MAISTIGVKFKYGATESSMKEIPIKTFPDPIGASEYIDTTTMSDTERTGIPGLKGSNSALQMTCNYDAATYDEVSALSGDVFQQITFPDGSGFKWKGELQVGMADGSVNNVLEMTLYSFKSTAVERIAATA